MDNKLAWIHLRGEHIYEIPLLYRKGRAYRGYAVINGYDVAGISYELSFACSLRIGEVLGLQWSNVNITDKNIDDDNAYIDIKQELVEAHVTSLEVLENKDVIFEFPYSIDKANRKTKTILKKPKTESSIRRIWLPKTLAYILKQWKQEQEEYKEYFGSEYRDYDLVVCLEDGKFCSQSVIRKGFKNLAEAAGLPYVVFHSLRHSSTTYKLKLNHGDIKATQGDTGHSQSDMITDVYSHIQDEDRKVNAQKFNDSFYSSIDEYEEKETKSKIDIDTLVSELAKNPELLNQLKEVLKS